MKPHDFDTLKTLLQPEPKSIQYVNKLQLDCLSEDPAYQDFSPNLKRFIERQLKISKGEVKCYS